MSVPLPPNLKQSTIDSLPARHREDAIQEAWVAYLSGKSPNAAAKNYVAKETKHEKRTTPASQLHDNQLTKKDKARLD